MTYKTITVSTNDSNLRYRIQSCVNKEAQNNAELSASVFGQYCLNNPWVGWQALIWPVCTAVEDAYAYALANGNVDPGGDESVITDGAILAAVQANWPDEVPDFLPPSPPI